MSTLYNSALSCHSDFVINSIQFNSVSVQQQSAVLPPRNKLLCLRLRKEFRLLFRRLLIVALTFFGACIPTIVVMYLHPTPSSRQTRSFRRKIIWCSFAMIFNAAVDPLIYSTNHPIFKRYFNNARNRIFPQHTVAVAVGQWTCSHAVL
jgi:hypothetical protein